MKVLFEKGVTAWTKESHNRVKGEEVTVIPKCLRTEPYRINLRFSILRIKREVDEYAYSRTIKRCGKIVFIYNLFLTYKMNFIVNNF